MKYIATFKQNKIKENPEYVKLLLDNFDTFYLVGHGLDSPSEEKLQLYMDGLDYLVDRGKTVIGHSLMCHSKRFNKSPILYQIDRKSKPEQEQCLYDFFKHILDRTRGKISDWYVFNECSRRRNLAQVIFGDNFIEPVIEMVRDIDPTLNLRLNEYGYQDQGIVTKLIEHANTCQVGIGMQAYCSNPLFYIKLEATIKRLRNAFPDRELYLSEISVLDQSLFSEKMYKQIKRIAEKYDIKEIGFWWPTGLYTEKCWSRKPVTIWDENLLPTRNKKVFF